MPAQQFKRQLHRVYAGYAVGLLAFVLLLGLLEKLGLGRAAIGMAFLVASILLYAGIGFLSRTSDASDYYVAGRRVPAIYNGMATAADWLSAASFMGLAGTLFLSGYGGLAYVLGWSGGFCLLAMLLAPYLRRFGQYTVPDFLGARYGGHLPRLLGVVAAILCSFTYVVAQIYGVGLIATSLTGTTFEIGVFAGLAGILMCSFLGGMRAVTWTQVAQYMVLLLALLLPATWLAVKQTGLPLPPLVLGQQLQQVEAAERRILADPREQAVIAHYQARAAVLDQMLRDVPSELARERSALEQRLAMLEAEQAALAEIQAAEQELARLPLSEAGARAAWTRERDQARERARPLGGMPPHAQPFKGDPEGDAAARKLFNEDRRNFLALVFCLTVGTAGLPHILMRYYTTPSVREARSSVAWTLFFILLLYLLVPALAVMVKVELLQHLVGQPFAQLPEWLARWSKLDPNLLAAADANGDGVLQLGELRIAGDILVLAMPEIAGLPYVMTGLVAAGALAAALSTADGLLLTISNALGHDTYYRVLAPQASAGRRVTISKILLLVVALLAAAVASQRPADILFLVSAAFSFAASSFFPALVLGVFWKRANGWGASAGLIAGLGMTFYYMATTQPWLRGVFGVSRPLEDCIWWGIQPVSAGVFGVPLGFAVIVLVSLLTPPPPAETERFVWQLRTPEPPADE